MTQDKISELISIGDLAKQLNISTRTIRYYEERGLISPQRTDGGQRVYTRRERGRLKLILRAKLAGLDLEESREVIDLYDRVPHDQLEQAQLTRLSEMLNRRVFELNDKIEQLIELRDELEEQLEGINESLLRRN